MKKWDEQIGYWYNEDVRLLDPEEHLLGHKR